MVLRVNNILMGLVFGIMWFLAIVSGKGEAVVGMLLLTFAFAGFVYLAEESMGKVRNEQMIAKKEIEIKNAQLECREAIDKLIKTYRCYGVTTDLSVNKILEEVIGIFNSCNTADEYMAVKSKATNLMDRLHVNARLAMICAMGNKAEEEISYLVAN